MARKIPSLKSLELCYSSVRTCTLVNSLSALEELNLDSCGDWAIGHLADKVVVLI
jgi:hypothetical protein